jgi:proteasome activator subunit 3 (PA28 gamma)
MNLRDSARQHHLTRAKIASKLLKYPHIEDYAVSGADAGRLAKR